MTAQLSMSGESLVMIIPPYESVIREGVMVSTLVATYQGPEGEETVPGTIAGSRGGL